jgi:putative addiction module component (TIGR02574 family)
VLERLNGDWQKTTMTLVTKEDKMNVANLLEEALRLPEDERVHLALQLLQTLTNTEEPDAEKAWEQELRERLDDLKSGRVKGLSLKKALRIIMDDDE